MTATDPAHRHGGPGAGWYRPTAGGWDRITDGEVGRYPYAAHFMEPPGIPDWERELLERQAREMSQCPVPASPASPPNSNPAAQIRWMISYLESRYGTQQATP